MGLFLGVSVSLGGLHNQVNVLPKADLISWYKTDTIDRIGDHDGEVFLKQSGLFATGDYLTGDIALGTTVVGEHGGDGAISLTENKLDYTVAESLWSFELSNGSTYEYPTKISSTQAVWLDTSGNGRNLTLANATAVDADAHCVESLAIGSDWLNLRGYTTATGSQAIPETETLYQPGTPIPALVDGSGCIADRYIQSFGVLDTTWNSCLVREETDVAGMPDYSGDWAVEVAVDVDNYDGIGDYGELIRHGGVGCDYNPGVAGWRLGTNQAGYMADRNVGLRAVFSDGSGQQIARSIDVGYGRKHLAMVYTAATSTLTLYVDGVNASSASNVSMAPPIDMGQGVTIGGNNKLGIGYTTTTSWAMPNFKMHFARVWSGSLTASDISTIYNSWANTGAPTVPNTATATIATAYMMSGEVGDATGGTGTGWLIDDAGGNHLKIVETNLTGEISTLWTPDGAVRCVAPIDGATNISGAAYLQASGVLDQSGAMRYQFEIDEVSTFNSADYRQSDWMLGKGEWQPKLKPATIYYWRVRTQSTGVVAEQSEWTTPQSFTTRAVRDWYVRPRTTASTYGLEDGSSFANAWNGLRYNGGKSSFVFASMTKQADFSQVAPGDTVYLCNNWGLMESATWALDATKPQIEAIHCAGLSSDYQINIKLDHPTYPASSYKMFRYTGDYAWTNEGGGVYSTAQYPTQGFARIAIDDGNGTPIIDINDHDSDTLLYDDTTDSLVSPGFYISGGRMYVRMPDDTSPGTRLWYMINDVYTFGLNLLGTKYTRLIGGDFYGGFVSGSVTGAESTDLYLQGQKLKYVNAEAGIYIADGCHNWTIDGLEISYTLNGIYGYNTGELETRRTGDGITVKNCHIHHIGVTGWTDGDSHCIGWQSGNNWTIEDNHLHDSGSAIENWTSSWKESSDHSIKRNLIHDITAKSVTFGAGIAFTSGGVELGLRAGIEIADNVIYNTDGSGIHSTIGDPVTITGNMIGNTGLGVEDYSFDGISFRNISTSQAARCTIDSNVIYNPNDRFLNLGGLADSASGLLIDNNLYWDDPPANADDLDRFRALGLSPLTTDHSYNSWVANTTFDQNSEWGNPHTSTLPVTIDQAKIDLFLAEVTP